MGLSDLIEEEKTSCCVSVRVSVVLVIHQVEDCIITRAAHQRA